MEFYSKTFRNRKPDFDEYSDTLDETVQKILSLDNVADELEGSDIAETLPGPASYFDKPFSMISERELKDYVEKNLLIPKTYQVFFRLSTVVDFPDGYQLGQGRLAVPDSLPSSVKEFLSKRSALGLKKHTSISQEVMRLGLNTQFLTLSLKSYGPAKALQRATRSADEALHILRFEYEMNFSLSQFAILIDDQDRIQMREMNAETWVNYLPELDEITGKLNEILRKPDTTELENRLRNAVRLFGLAMDANRPEIRFVLLTNALEGLLLTRGDRDYLRFRLAEKVAFLVETEETKRLAEFEKIKRLYDRRSDFVHQNAKYEPIEDKDVEELKNVFFQVFNKLLILRSQGYASIEKRQGKYVDSLIDSLKFA